MRIATYNLFEGAQDTYPLVKEFVQTQNLDVLCIQEANGWQDGTPSRLDDFARTTGLTHYAFGDSNTRFKLATFSRFPQQAATIHKANFWHSAVQTSISYNNQTFDLWNVHLNPQDEDARQAEASQICKSLGQNSLIMGDFNSLSKQDKYPTALLDKLSRQGIRKFGTTALRYDVTGYFASQDLEDVAAARQANVSTVPTPTNKDMFHADNLRLDYMFASHGVLDLVEDIAVIKDDLTDQISDHYPIVLTLQ